MKRKMEEMQEWEFPDHGIDRYMSWKMIGENYFDKKYDDSKAIYLLIQLIIWILILHHLW
jgi:hypothetical protein